MTELEIDNIDYTIKHVSSEMTIWDLKRRIIKTFYDPETSTPDEISEILLPEEIMIYNEEMPLTENEYTIGEYNIENVGEQELTYKVLSHIFYEHPSDEIVSGIVEYARQVTQRNMMGPGGSDKYMLDNRMNEPEYLTLKRDEGQIEVGVEVVKILDLTESTSYHELMELEDMRHYRGGLIYSQGRNVNLVEYVLKVHIHKKTVSDPQILYKEIYDEYKLMSLRFLRNELEREREREVKAESGRELLEADYEITIECIKPYIIRDALFNYDKPVANKIQYSYLSRGGEEKEAILNLNEIFEQIVLDERVPFVRMLDQNMDVKFKFWGPIKDKDDLQEDLLTWVQSKRYSDVLVFKILLDSETNNYSVAYLYANGEIRVTSHLTMTVLRSNSLEALKELIDRINVVPGGFRVNKRLEADLAMWQKDPDMNNREIRINFLNANFNLLNYVKEEEESGPEYVDISQYDQVWMPNYPPQMKEFKFDGHMQQGSFRNFLGIPLVDVTYEVSTREYIVNVPLLPNNLGIFVLNDIVQIEYNTLQVVNNVSLQVMGVSINAKENMKRMILTELSEKGRGKMVYPLETMIGYYGHIYLVGNMCKSWKLMGKQMIMQVYSNFRLFNAGDVVTLSEPESEKKLHVRVYNVETLNDKTIKLNLDIAEWTVDERARMTESGEGRWRVYSAMKYIRECVAISPYKFAHYLSIMATRDRLTGELYKVATEEENLLNQIERASAEVDEGGVVGAGAGTGRDEDDLMLGEDDISYGMNMDEGVDTGNYKMNKIQKINQDLSNKQYFQLKLNYMIDFKNYHENNIETNQSLLRKYNLKFEQCLEPLTMMPVGTEVLRGETREGKSSGMIRTKDELEKVTNACKEIISSVEDLKMVTNFGYILKQTEEKASLVENKKKGATISFVQVEDRPGVSVRISGAKNELQLHYIQQAVVIIVHMYLNSPWYLSTHLETDQAGMSGQSGEKERNQQLYQKIFPNYHTKAMLKYHIPTVLTESQYKGLMQKYRGSDATEDSTDPQDGTSGAISTGGNTIWADLKTTGKPNLNYPEETTFYFYCRPHLHNIMYMLEQMKEIDNESAEEDGVGEEIYEIDQILLDVIEELEDYYNVITDYRSDFRKYRIAFYKQLREFAGRLQIPIPGTNISEEVRNQELFNRFLEYIKIALSPETDRYTRETVIDLVIEYFGPDKISKTPRFLSWNKTGILGCYEKFQHGKRGEIQSGKAGHAHIVTVSRTLAKPNNKAYLPRGDTDVFKYSLDTLFNNTLTPKNTQYLSFGVQSVNNIYHAYISAVDGVYHTLHTEERGVYVDQFIDELEKYVTDSVLRSIDGGSLYKNLTNMGLTSHSNKVLLIQTYIRSNMLTDEHIFDMLSRIEYNGQTYNIMVFDVNEGNMVCHRTQMSKRKPFIYLLKKYEMSGRAHYEPIFLYVEPKNERSNVTIMKEKNGSLSTTFKYTPEKQSIANFIWNLYQYSCRASENYADPVYKILSKIRQSHQYLPSVELGETLNEIGNYVEYMKPVYQVIDENNGALGVVLKIRMTGGGGPMQVGSHNKDEMVSDVMVVIPVKVSNPSNSLAIITQQEALRYMHNTVNTYWILNFVNDLIPRLGLKPLKQVLQRDGVGIKGGVSKVMAFFLRNGLYVRTQYSDSKAVELPLFEMTEAYASQNLISSHQVVFDLAIEKRGEESEAKSRESRMVYNKYKLSDLENYQRLRYELSNYMHVIENPYKPEVSMVMNAFGIDQNSAQKYVDEYEEGMTRYEKSGTGRKLYEELIKVIVSKQTLLEKRDEVMRRLTEWLQTIKYENKSEGVEANLYEIRMPNIRMPCNVFTGEKTCKYDPFCGWSGTKCELRLHEQLVEKYLSQLTMEIVNYNYVDQIMYNLSKYLRDEKNVGERKSLIQLILKIKNASEQVVDTSMKDEERLYQRVNGILTSVELGILPVVEEETMRELTYNIISDLKQITRSRDKLVDTESLIWSGTIRQVYLGNSNVLSGTISATGIERNVTDTAKYVEHVTLVGEANAVAWLKGTQQQKCQVSLIGVEANDPIGKMIYDNGYQGVIALDTFNLQMVTRDILCLFRVVANCVNYVDSGVKWPSENEDQTERALELKANALKWLQTNLEEVYTNELQVKDFLVRCNNINKSLENYFKQMYKSNLMTQLPNTYGGLGELYALSQIYPYNIYVFSKQIGMTKSEDLVRSKIPVVFRSAHPNGKNVCILYLNTKTYCAMYQDYGYSLSDLNLLTEVNEVTNYEMEADEVIETPVVAASEVIVGQSLSSGLGEMAESGMDEIVEEDESVEEDEASLVTEEERKKEVELVKLQRAGLKQVSLLESSMVGIENDVKECGRSVIDAVLYVMYGNMETYDELLLGSIGEQKVLLECTKEASTELQKYMRRRIVNRLREVKVGEVGEETMSKFVELYGVCMMGDGELLKCDVGEFIYNLMNILDVPAYDRGEKGDSKGDYKLRIEKSGEEYYVLLGPLKKKAVTDMNKMVKKYIEVPQSPVKIKIQTHTLTFRLADEQYMNYDELSVVKLLENYQKEKHEYTEDWSTSQIELYQRHDQTMLNLFKYVPANKQIERIYHKIDYQKFLNTPRSLIVLLDRGLSEGVPNWMSVKFGSHLKFNAANYTLRGIIMSVEEKDKKMHMTCYANHVNNGWLYMNDQLRPSVTPVDFASVLGNKQADPHPYKNAVALFYKL